MRRAVRIGRVKISEIILALFLNPVILSPVSERKNNMKNQMTMTEIRRHFEERRLRTFVDRQTKETRRLEKLKAAKEKLKKELTLNLKYETINTL